MNPTDLHNACGLFLVLVLAAWLSGCSEAPDEDQVKHVIQKRLASAFEPGTFSLTSLRRLGSGSLPNAADGRSQRIVDYNAVLGFERDLNFSSWEALNIAAFANLLGATEKGVFGLPQGGNKQGDRIHETGLERGLRMLSEGNIDAVMATVSAPARRIQKAAVGKKIRFLRIPPDVRPTLTEAGAGLVPIRLRAGTCPNQREPFDTVAVTALLAASEGLPKRDVQQVLTAVFDQINFLDAGSAAGSRTTARRRRSA